MENHSFLEKIFLYGVVGGVILIVATLCRYVSITMGSDDFTAFIVFIVCIILGISLYSMIKLVLIEVLNLFSKKKVVNKEAVENKKIENIVEKGEEESIKDTIVIDDDGNKKIETNITNVAGGIKENTVVIDKEAGENKKIEKIADSEGIIEKTIVVNKVKLDDSEELSKIIDKKQKEKLEEQKKKIEIAIKYTQVEFTPYVTKEDLIKLCENIQLYSEKGNIENVKPIKVNHLKAIDIYHFGWNIWKYFKVTNQSELAGFIKNVFKELLQDVGIDTIMKSLTKDEKQGVIKIKSERLF